MVRVGILGGRRLRVTSPWPGLAMEDSKGDFIGMLDESSVVSCREEEGGEEEVTERESGIVAVTAEMG